MAWVATAIVGSAAVGAATSIYTSGRASQAQREAAQVQQQQGNRAFDTSMGMYNQTRNDLNPFRDVGYGATGELGTRLKDLTTPIQFDPDGTVKPIADLTQAELEATPGYKFALSQGQRAAHNSAAARGLGASGAALKGAMTFATGLADNTYMNQWAVKNQQYQNALNLATAKYQASSGGQKSVFDRLKALIDTGHSAAAGTGAAGTSAAGQAGTAAGMVGSGAIGAGNAEANGWNAIGGSVNNFANAAGGYGLYRGIYGGGGSGSPASSPIGNAFGFNPVAGSYGGNGGGMRAGPEYIAQFGGSA